MDLSIEAEVHLFGAKKKKGFWPHWALKMINLWHKEGLF